jgi:hypothetical protein
LHDAARAARRGDHAFALVRRLAGRLFDIDVLARQAGQDRCGRVPVIRRGANDGVDGRIVERLAEILDSLRLAPAMGNCRVDPFLNCPLVAIADVGNFSAGLLCKVSRQLRAAAVRAHNREHNGVVGGCSAADVS